MVTRIALALMLALSLAACGTETAQDKLADIEKRMQKELPMTPAEEEALKTATEQGKQFLAEGKEQEASAAFDKALKLVVKAEFGKLHAHSE